MRWALVLCVMAALAPSAASASTASLSGRTDTVHTGHGGTTTVSYYTLVVQAGPMETNGMVITAGSDAIEVEDAAGIRPGDGCSQSDANTLSCPFNLPGSPAVEKVEVDTADGDDELELRLGESFFTRTVLRGGDGNDRLVGSGSWDLLDGGAGSDELVGGYGVDTLTYETRTAGVWVNPDGTANDGEVGEFDLVGDDVELVIGGSGADTLEAASAPDGYPRVEGGPGNDVLFGSATRHSDLRGGGGDDRLEARGQSVSFYGGPGSDVMRGSPESDGVSYEEATAGVTVTLDGEQNDGEPGERDLIVGIENFQGSRFDDVFIGDEFANSATGGAGYDRLYGKAGADRLFADNDGGLLHGGQGSDWLSSANFNRNGITRIEAVDGEADSGHCYAGVVLRVDATDDFSNCPEPRFVLRAGPSWDVAAARERIAFECEREAKVGLVLVGPRGRASGTLELTAGGVTIGHGRFELRTSVWRHSVLRLTRRGARIVRRTGPVVADLRIRGIDDQGAEIVSRDVLTLAARLRRDC